MGELFLVQVARSSRIILKRGTLQNSRGPLGRSEPCVNYQPGLQERIWACWTIGIDGNWSRSWQANQSRHLAPGTTISFGSICADSVTGLYRLFAHHRYDRATDGWACTAISIPSVWLIIENHHQPYDVRWKRIGRSRWALHVWFRFAQSWRRRNLQPLFSVSIGLWYHVAYCSWAEKWQARHCITLMLQLQLCTWAQTMLKRKCF